MKPILPKSGGAKTSFYLCRNRADDFLSPGSRIADDSRYWRWGDDNLFPYALSVLSRRSTVHRRILNDKAGYISGKGFSCDPAQKALRALVESANGTGESLRQVFNRLAFDKLLLGNAFLEIATDPGRTSLSLFHQDATRCRLAKDRTHILLHHDWREFAPARAQRLPLYPAFEKAPDGTLRSVLHYRDYEPMFENYGVPSYIAGMNVSAIAYKTDRWNISRLDNSFQLSGILVLDAEVDNDAEAENILRKAEARFAGKPGQVMFLVKEAGEKEGSKFIPLSSDHEGDWKDLHAQAGADLIAAHSWFRSLSGLDYASGFSSERILHEYEVALNTLILGQQEELLEPIRGVIRDLLQTDAASLQVVNRPPAQARPAYMKVWEARKIDGLPYDEHDPLQQRFLSELTRP